MSRHPRAALQRDIDALDLLWREHQGIRRHFATMTRWRRRLPISMPASRSLRPAFYRTSMPRTAGPSFSRQSMLTTTRWAAARLAA
jgi:hypothetical protein